MSLPLPITVSFLSLGIAITSSVMGGESQVKPRVVMNDDCQVLLEAPETNASDFVKAWFDRELDAVPSTTFVILAATPDICTYDTNVGERYGARFGNDFQDGWAGGIRALRTEGTDVLRLACSHVKAKGCEVLAAIRMNDTHHRSVDPSNPFCPQFTIDHPEYVIKQPDGRTNETALDYSYPEVRAHRLAIMREIVEQYDVDGLELNFIRWAKHFPRDKGREKAPILSAYVGEIRQTLDAAAKKRGVERLTLGVRVPESVETCWLAGVDIETWVEKGWLDFVVLSTFNNTDPQLPVDEFTRFTKPAGVETLVTMGNMIGAIWGGPPTILDRPVAMSAKHANGYVGMLITEAEARAAVANYYAWGADGISFWNVGIHFGQAKTAAPEQRKRIRRWTHTAADPQKVYEGPRVYRYLPMGKGVSTRKPPARNYPWYDEGHSPLGRPNSPTLEFTEEQIGKRLVFPFRMADGRDGENLNGAMRFWIYHIAKDDEIVVDVNGRLIDGEKITKFAVGQLRGGLPGQRFEIALSDCPAFRGDNELGLTLRSRKQRESAPYMEELEVRVERQSTGAEETAIDLSSEDAAQRWVFLDDSAAICDGELVLDGRRQMSRAFHEPLEWADVTLRAKFLVEPAERGVLACGFVVRAENAATYYYVHFDRRQAILVRSDPSVSWNEIKRIGGLTKPAGQWHEGELECVGDTLKVRLNGKLLFEAKDETLKRGRIGFYANQGRAHVKDIVVTGRAHTAAGELKVPPRPFIYVCTDAGAGGYEAFPDVGRLSDGRLMSVFYAGYGHVSLPNEQLPRGGRICCCTSSDEGRSWSNARVLYDGPDDDRDPSIAQLSGGRLICNFFSLRKTEQPGKRWIGLGSWMVASDDLGKTWSKPQQIAEGAYCSAPVRELSDGRLLLGLYRETKESANGAVAISDDGGQTWSDVIDIDNGGIRLDAETDIIELKDGTLYAAQRAKMCFSISKDRGQTWSVSKPIGFAGHCPYFLRTRDDIILLAHRVPSTSLHYSLDECKTWSDNIPVDTVGGAYPSMVNLQDGSVLIVYYEEGGGSSIRAKRLRATPSGIEWLP